MVILASLLDASIPLLASLRLLSQLGAVLDLPKQSCRLHKIGVTVQLAKTLGGHLALRVTQFPKEGMPRSADMWHHKRQPGVEVVLDPAKSAASADADARGESESTKHITHNTGMAEGTHVLAAAVSGSSSEAPNSTASVGNAARTRRALASAMACGMARGDGGSPDVAPPFPTTGHSVPSTRSRASDQHSTPWSGPRADAGELHTPEQPDAPVRESARQVHEVRNVRRPVALGRSHGLLALLVSILALVTATSEPGQYLPSCYGEQGKGQEQGEGQGKGDFREFPDPGFLAADPHTPSSTRVRSPERHEPRTSGRPERSIRLEPAQRLGLKKGQRKQLAAQARRAHQVLSLEYAILGSELAKAADARRRVTHSADFLQMTPCERGENLTSAGLRSPQEQWDIATHRGRKQWVESLRYHKPWPLVVAVRLADSPSHGTPEVINSVLRTVAHQQRCSRYWVIIAPRTHPVWRHPGISRLVTEGQHFITRASETIVSNHEWLTQASPGSPTGLSERVRRIAREMDPTRFHTEAPESRRTPACGEMDRVSTRPVNHETLRPRPQDMARGHENGGRRLQGKFPAADHSEPGTRHPETGGTAHPMAGGKDPNRQNTKGAANAN